MTRRRRASQPPSRRPCRRTAPRAKSSTALLVPLRPPSTTLDNAEVNQGERTVFGTAASIAAPHAGNPHPVGRAVRMSQHLRDGHDSQPVMVACRRGVALAATCESPEGWLPDRRRLQRHGSMAMNECVNGKAANRFVKITAPELIPRYGRPLVHLRFVFPQGTQPMSTGFHATPGWNPEIVAQTESNHRKDSDDARCLNQESARDCSPEGSGCSPLIRCAAAVSHRRPAVHHSR
jgi:hypothetical protein